MKPARFAYAAPETLDETLALLREHGDEAKVLAGGQSLVPLLNMRLALPGVVVDIGGVAALRESTTAPEGCRYGAAVTHSAFEDRLVPDPTRGLLPTAAAGIGYRAVRNRGTLGGSLAHADASAEWPVVMAALNATLTATSAAGEREIPARSFVEGFFTNALAEDELVTKVSVPGLPESARWGLYKAARKPGEFADSLAAVVVTMRDGIVEAAQAWLGAAADVPTPVTALAEHMPGRRLSDVDREEVAAAVAAALEPPRSSDERYRVHVHGVAVWRALRQIDGGRP